MKLYTKMLLATVLAFPMLLGAAAAPKGEAEAPKNKEQQRFHDPYADPDARTYEGVYEGDYLPAPEEELTEPQYTQEEWDKATKGATAQNEDANSSKK